VTKSWIVQPSNSEYYEEERLPVKNLKQRCGMIGDWKLHQHA